MELTGSSISLTPGIPTYPEARAFLKAIDGIPYTTYRSMYDQILDQRGSPQENEDWSDPESWIPERLRGPERICFKAMARHEGSSKPTTYTRILVLHQPACVASSGCP